MRQLLCILYFATFSSLVVAQNSDDGEELHMENCTGCHGSEMYTRQDRKVSSLTELETRVRFCKNNLGVTWFDDEVDDVIHYLNTEYYRFK